MGLLRSALATLALLVLTACGDPVAPAGPRPRVDSGPVEGGLDAGTLDGGPQCPAPTIPCGDRCLDVSADPTNCGGCGVTCGIGEVCSAASCVAGGCPSGTTECSSACVTTATDARHCGGCGMACGASETCVAGACVACGTGTSFAADIQPIFTASCQGAACHGGMRPAGDLSLEEGQAHAALVGVASSCAGVLRVAPSSPDDSYLVHKIEGVHACSGNRMPLGGAPLPAAQIAIIRDWICGGARED